MNNNALLFKRCQALKSQWKIERSESILKRHAGLMPINERNQALHEIKNLKAVHFAYYGVIN